MDHRGVRPAGCGSRSEGNRLANSAPLDNYATADGRYFCIVAGSDANFARLAKAMGRAELSGDERFATLERRAANGDLINGIVAGWCAERTAAEVEEVCLAHDVPVATAYSAADIAADPHVRERGDLVTVDGPVLGPVLQQTAYPRLGSQPPPPPRGAPRLGEHNDEVWGDVLTSEEYEAAHIAGAI